jgi:hypothetical protein
MASQPPEPSSFVVHISDEAVRHIRDKHIQDPSEHPCWVAFLQGQVDIASLLEPEIQRSIRRPLFVEYDQYDVNGTFLHTTRECVTRAGLVAVVRLTSEDSGDVVTAFFPAETFEARPQRRWLGARESRIKVYASRVAFGLAQSLQVPPSPTEVIPSVDPPGERRNLCFVNDERWGIRAVQIDDSTVRAFATPPPWPVE